MSSWKFRSFARVIVGVVASCLADDDIWAVAHWDGSVWSVVNLVDVGVNGNQFYAVAAHASSDVFAVGQKAGAGFPSEALIEHWHGKAWRVLPSPADPAATALPLGVAATANSLTVVGQQETDKAPYTTYIAAGSAGSGSADLSIQKTPSSGAGENDPFSAATAADGSTWAVGWDIFNSKSGNHGPLVAFPAVKRRRRRGATSAPVGLRPIAAKLARRFVLQALILMSAGRVKPRRNFKRDRNRSSRLLPLVFAGPIC